MTVSWPRVLHQVAKLREEHTSAQNSLAAVLAELAASSEKETEHYDIAQVYATPLCDFRHSEGFSVCVRVFGSSRWRTRDHLLFYPFWGLQLLTLNLWYCFHTPASNSGSFSSSPGFGQCAGQKMEFAPRQKLGPMLKSGSSCHPALYLKAAQCQNLQI
jgi:hypothetical protein